MFKIDLHPNETVVGIYRQTEFVLVKTVLIILISIYLPIALLLKYELLEKFSRLAITWTILVAGYGVYKYFLWLLNNYIVTNKRILCVKYFSLLHKQILETPFEKIANISFRSKGILSLTDVGTVEIHVTGVIEPLEMNNLRHPQKIKDAIWKASAKKPDTAMKIISSTI
jgi:hypothetical protein